MASQESGWEILMGASDVDNPNITIRSLRCISLFKFILTSTFFAYCWLEMAVKQSVRVSQVRNVTLSTSPVILLSQRTETMLIKNKRKRTTFSRAYRVIWGVYLVNDCPLGCKHYWRDNESCSEPSFQRTLSSQIGKKQRDRALRSSWAYVARGGRKHNGVKSFCS